MHGWSASGLRFEWALNCCTLRKNAAAPLCLGSDGFQALDAFAWHGASYGRRFRRGWRIEAGRVRGDEDGVLISREVDPGVLNNEGPAPIKFLKRGKNVK